MRPNGHGGLDSAVSSGTVALSALRSDNGQSPKGAGMALKAPHRAHTTPSATSHMRRWFESRSACRTSSRDEKPRFVRHGWQPSGSSGHNPRNRVAPPARDAFVLPVCAAVRAADPIVTRELSPRTPPSCGPRDARRLRADVRLPRLRAVHGLSRRRSPAGLAASDTTTLVAVGDGELDMHYLMRPRRRRGSARCRRRGLLSPAYRRAARTSRRRRRKP
jgi:hypothetical protein